MTLNNSTHHILAEVRKLIIHAAHRGDSTGEILRSWTREHFAFARAHLLGPWLYRRLADHDRAIVSREILRALQQDYLKSSLVCLARSQYVKRLAISFDAHGIPLVLLKGAFLGEVVYGNAAERPMADVDILVREDHDEQALGLLKSMGYKQLVEPLELLQRALNPGLALVHQDRYEATIDLHRGLWFMDHYRLPPERIWNDVLPGSFDDRRVLYLSPELNFIHVALHHFAHASSIRDWLDMVLLIAHEPFHWNRVVRLAQSLGVVRPIYWIVRELAREWEVAVPPDVQQAMAAYTPRWMEDPIIRSRFRYAWRFASRFRFIDGWPSKLAYLRLCLLPSAEYRKAVIGTTAWLSYMRSKLGFFVRLAR